MSKSINQISQAKPSQAKPSQFIVLFLSLNTNAPDTKKAPEGAFFLSLRDNS
ncbi:hypothetical protein [Vibrio toranzoniae]|uniref:hypothetical protein n=1 Tax=Vibrio toranzoniae TaxID=1194427 RepID=UPI001376DDD2|nr:hypothetical protein [Vibrio toranzoniae]NAZ96801.1 hypothetical protein [Vibrio toranzoniae]